MLPIDYLPGAKLDFDESFDWYAGRSLQAALRFADAVDAAMVKVATNPDRFVAVDDRHRACSLKRFPFRIVYRVVGNRVLVVAVAHAKRQPGYWKARS